MIAIAKWETDKGMPDIQNLKAIAYVLDVSIDYLLADGSQIELSVMREPIEFSKYGKGRKKVIKDKIVRERYPDAEIMTLVPEEKLTKAEKVMNAIVWIFTPLCDVFHLAKGFNNLDNEFYLVNHGNKQYLVKVTSEFIESRELSEPVVEQRFEVGNYKFVNCGPIIYGEK